MTDEPNAIFTQAPQPGVDAEARATALELRLAELEATTTARLIRAELKTEAERAGMVDLDGLKMGYEGIQCGYGDTGALAGWKSLHWEPALGSRATSPQRLRDWKGHHV